MERLNERERITILMMRGWGQVERSMRAVMNVFNETFRVGRTPIALSTVQNTIRRFNNVGNVRDLPRSGRRRSVTNEDKSLDVLLSFTENPHTSVRKAAQEHDISKSSVHNILKIAKFHPFKAKLVHKLNEDDFDRRVEFSEDMMACIVEDPDFPSRIAFSDEATFQLDGTLNRHNCRYWADENPHWMREDQSQYPQKLNVWAGILNNRIIGPFFIDGNLDAQNYEAMLRDLIIPAIREIAGDNFEETWYQQDGAAAHYGQNVRAYLDQIFVNRWVGRRGTIEWPARSPDLTPLDYFYWGYLKDRVFETKPENLDELRQRIIDVSALIPTEIIKNAIDAFYHRLAYCQEVNGQQFEHLK